MGGDRKLPGVHLEVTNTARLSMQGPQAHRKPHAEEGVYDTCTTLIAGSSLAIIWKAQKRAGGHDERGVERGDEPGVWSRLAFHRIRGPASPS